MVQYIEYYLIALPHEDDYSFPENWFPATTNHTPYFETENNNAGFPFEIDEENNVDYNAKVFTHVFTLKCIASCKFCHYLYYL
jgi:hypothetical protein